MVKSRVPTCYYCNDILKEEDLVIKPIPLVCKNGKVRMYKRKFHMWCLPKYLDAHKSEAVQQAETDGWDKVYQYFKLSILGLPVTSNLDTHSVERLLGLHVGQFKPNGSNIRGLERGYSWDCIYYTMQICKRTIQDSFETMTFTGDEHKTNYAMKIIAKNINFVQSKLKAAEKQQANVERLADQVKDKPKFKRRNYKKQGTSNKFGEL